MELWMRMRESQQMVLLELMVKILVLLLELMVKIEALLELMVESQQMELWMRMRIAMKVSPLMTKTQTAMKVNPLMTKTQNLLMMMMERVKIYPRRGMRLQNLGEGGCDE